MGAREKVEAALRADWPASKQDSGPEEGLTGDLIKLYSLGSLILEMSTVDRERRQVSPDDGCDGPSVRVTARGRGIHSSLTRCEEEPPTFR